MNVARRAVRMAKAITRPAQATVTHEAWTGQNEHGDATFATGVARMALVETKRQTKMEPSADVSEIQTSVIFLEPIAANGASGRREPIDPRDRLTLPDGSTGPILDIKGVTDPSSTAPYMFEVLMGAGS